MRLLLGLVTPAIEEVVADRLGCPKLGIGVYGQRRALREQAQDPFPSVTRVRSASTGFCYHRGMRTPAESGSRGLAEEEVSGEAEEAGATTNLVGSY